MNVANGRVKRHTIDSRFLNEERGFWVYVPAHFQLENHYPILYAHDGDDYLNMGRIRTIANERIGAGTLQPIVIVGIPVDKTNRHAEYHPDGDRFQAYMSFITDELIPYVEGQGGLHIKAKERGTIGSSLGGVVGCQLAWKHPELFQVVISQSGAFYSSSMTELLHSGQQVKKVRHYFLVGTDESDVATSSGSIDFLSANRKLMELLEDIGIPFHYEERQGGHTWGLWQKNLPDALAYFWSTR